VHLKCENFGLALSDSSAAIELNPQNTKAYYRRGMAYFALTKFSLASKDFRQVRICIFRVKTIFT